MIDSTKKKHVLWIHAYPRAKPTVYIIRVQIMVYPIFHGKNQVYQHVMENDVTLGDGWCLKNGLQRPLLS